MKQKIVRKTSAYKVYGSNNRYSIMTCDSLDCDNIILVGKKQLLKVALALIKMALFSKTITVVNVYK